MQDLSLPLPEATPPPPGPASADVVVAAAPPPSHHRQQRTSEASSASSASKQRRGDIQVLRALAVTLVVLFHLPGLQSWRGGFIGVDVFFVVSGYLVFGPMVREVEGGSFSLTSFLCRRMKRLSLPSAVALALLALLLLLSPQCQGGAHMCRAYWSDISAASLHYANWHLLAASGEYFANANPSIVLHYWSLAVEEQLYVAIPVAFLLYRRLAALARAPRLLSVPAFFAATSLVSLSLIYALPDSAKFYCALPRYWEFCAGAMVARAHDSGGSRGVFEGSGALRACGWAAYCACWAFLAACGQLVGSASYPNTTTVAVVAATAFVLWYRAGLRCRPLEALGDMSYSVYLYHWPAMQLLVYALAGSAGGPSARAFLWFAALALTLALAHTSYTVVEALCTRVAWPRPLVLLVFALGSALPALLCWHGAHAATTAAAGTGQAAAFNASALAGPAGPCGAQGAFSAGNPWRRVPWQANNTCDVGALRRNLLNSRISFHTDASPWAALLANASARGGPEEDCALFVVGDSHAQHFYPAVTRYARALGVALLAGTANHAGSWLDYSPVAETRRFPQALARYRHRVGLTSGLTQNATQRQTFASFVTAWAARACLVVGADAPHWLWGREIEHDGWRRRDCVLGREPQSCAAPAGAVQHPDARWFAELVREVPGLAGNATMVNTNDLVCWAGRCEAHANNVPVYSDNNHYSAQFLELAAPWWIARLRATHCFASLEFHLGKRALMDRVFGPPDYTDAYGPL
eukprot:m51a1_g7117 hypothetical protein (754) ;mRNA; f:106753-109439